MDTHDVIAVVLDAGSLFRDAGMAAVSDNPPPPVDEVTAQIRAGRVWVAEQDGEVVGCLFVGVVDGDGHIEQVSTARCHQGRGLGRRLVRTAENWARAQGHHRVTLTTFSQVPWNAPYYEHLGYRVLPAEQLGPELAAARATEVALGLDVWGRCAMFRDLATDIDG